MFTIWGTVAILLGIGLLAILAAVYFGRQYKAVGIRKNKLLCVCGTVTASVCIITAVQIVLMFRTVLWG